MTQVDLLYVSHNRREFTEATFETLLANTAWETVARLHVLDDRSRDGTADGLEDAVRRSPVSTRFESRKFGGPVAAMNDALDHCKTETLLKVDSDFVVCPGWLEALLAVWDANPRLDILGLEAGFGEGLAPADAPRSVLPCRWIGGIGLMRTRVFEKKRPKPSGIAGRHGWTQFQRDWKGLKGWMTPDLPCFALDRVPDEPWRSLTDRYVANGWQRRWDPYPEEMRGYFDWWLKAKVPA